MSRPSDKSTAESVREYIARIRRYPLLSPEEEAEVIGCWLEGRPILLRGRLRRNGVWQDVHWFEAPRHFLLECNLRHVIYPARRIARSWYKRHNYWQALRELIGAGNFGLVLAAERFRLDAGVLFVTASKDSIRKELIRQAKFDKGRGATRPYDVKVPSDILLDSLPGERDRAIEIPEPGVPKARQLCIVQMDSGKREGDSKFSDILAAGVAKLSADRDENTLLTRQIWFEVRRVRYERPALKTSYKVIAKNLDCSPARISQMAGKTSEKIHAAVMSNAGERRVVPFPNWRNIDKWCDLPKRDRDKSMADWRGDQPTSAAFSLRGAARFATEPAAWNALMDRGRPEKAKYKRLVPSAKHRKVPVGACDYNLARVAAALDEGREIPEELQFTTPDGYNPANHFTKLIEWRKAAEQQDQEQRERVERYRENKSLEQRVALTAKGYRKARELDRETENAAQTSTGEHSPPAKRAGSAA